MMAMLHFKKNKKSRWGKIQAERQRTEEQKHPFVWAGSKCKLKLFLTRGYPIRRSETFPLLKNAFLTPWSNVFVFLFIFKPPFNYTSFDSWDGWRPTKEFPQQPVSQWGSSLSVSHLSSGSVSRGVPAACGYMEVILKHTATFHQQSNSPFQTKSSSHYYSMNRYGPDSKFTQPVLVQECCIFSVCWEVLKHDALVWISS